ncbi:MAG TPA: PIG-L family deacetylase [Chryseosolibacter sp.]|jgi:LmbE family N-acetylglucosaminyl deacetylase|nr:PIG-L family deacetylase [Chryseosolibacter sp.]
MKRLFFLLFIFPLALLAQQKEKPRKCILVFGAHADDVESLAGGTLAKYIAEGYEGIYVGVVNNLAGCSLNRTPYFNAPPFTMSGSPKEYPVGALETSQIREEEARAAAAALGATPVFLNYNEPWFSMGRKQIDYGTDLFYQYAPAGRPTVSLATYLDDEVDFVFELLKKYRPEIVIIHTLGGEKHDHGNSGYMMYMAFKKAVQQNVPVGKLWMRVDGWLRDSQRGKPDVRVDIKKYLKVKYEAYDKHVSQNGGTGRAYFMRNRDKSQEGVEEFITVLDNTW